MLKQINKIINIPFKISDTFPLECMIASVNLKSLSTAYEISNGRIASSRYDFSLELNMPIELTTLTKFDNESRNSKRTFTKLGFRPWPNNESVLRCRTKRITFVKFYLNSNEFFVFACKTGLDINMSGSKIKFTMNMRLWNKVFV